MNVSASRSIIDPKLPETAYEIFRLHSVNASGSCAISKALSYKEVEAGNFS